MYLSFIYNSSVSITIFTYVYAAQQKVPEEKEKKPVLKKPKTAKKEGPEEWENIPDYDRPVLEKYEPGDHPDYKGREKTQLTKVRWSKNHLSVFFTQFVVGETKFTTNQDSRGSKDRGCEGKNT